MELGVPETREWGTAWGTEVKEHREEQEGKGQERCLKSNILMGLRNIKLNFIWSVGSSFFIFLLIFFSSHDDVKWNI